MIFHAIYRALCIQLDNFVYDDCENMSIIIINRSEIWPICHFWWLGHETTVHIVYLYVTRTIGHFYNVVKHDIMILNTPWHQSHIYNLEQTWNSPNTLHSSLYGMCIVSIVDDTGRVVTTPQFIYLNTAPGVDVSPTSAAEHGNGSQSVLLPRHTRRPTHGRSNVWFAPCSGSARGIGTNIWSGIAVIFEKIGYHTN